MNVPPCQLTVTITLYERAAFWEVKAPDSEPYRQMVHAAVISCCTVHCIGLY